MVGVKWFPVNGEIYLGSTPSNPRFMDVLPEGCGDGPVPDDIEERLRVESEARERRIAAGQATRLDRLIEGFRNPPKLRRRKFGPWTPIR